jgi:hypothetical protein
MGYTPRPVDATSQGVTEGLLLYSIYRGIGTMLHLVANNLLGSVDNRNRVRNPKAYVLHELAQVLHFVNYKKRMAKVSEECAPVLTHIEMAAGALEKLPIRNAAGDAFTANWHIEYCTRRANAIRELKKWVLLPKSDTGVHLKDALRDRIALIAKDDWDGLPEVVRDQPPPISWKKRLLKTLRSIASATIPLTVVYAGGDHIAWPTSEIRTYATFFAWAWALVTVLPLVDSGFQEKLSVLKDLPKLPFGDGAKKE